MKNYWYMFRIHECPVCGMHKKYKERRFDKKPLVDSERYNYHQVYDYCVSRQNN